MSRLSVAKASVSHCIALRRVFSFRGRRYTAENRARIRAALMLAVLLMPGPYRGSALAESIDLGLPVDIATFADGRKPIEQLYEAYLSLLDQGWTLDIVVNSQPVGTSYALPVIALRSPHGGAATWILSGIHGEEPAGPNAIAMAIDAIADIGRQHAVVLLPLCNPHGYVRNWRYLNTAIYSETVDGSSVGDSSHLLAEEGDPGLTRAKAASSEEADALTRYVLTRIEQYPPRVSIDLHEDNLLDAGYVYSQGKLGAQDPLAVEAVAVLRQHGVPIKLSGTTRFGESIIDGIIGPVIDSSIDELMSSDEVMVDGRAAKGPGAQTVLVFETPAASLTLLQRTAAHAALLRRLLGQIASPDRSTSVR